MFWLELGRWRRRYWTKTTLGNFAHIISADYGQNGGCRPNRFSVKYIQSIEPTTRIAMICRTFRQRVWLRSYGGKTDSKNVFPGKCGGIARGKAGNNAPGKSGGVNG